MTIMNRRNFVATLGLAGSAALLAGCSNDTQEPAADATTGDDAAESTDEASYTLVKEGVLTNVAELGFSPFEYIDEDGNTVDSWSITMDGEDITVAFNPSYLVDGLSAISEPFVRMKMTTAVKPVEFNGQQEADSDESMDYRYLLVPMRFNN